MTDTKHFESSQRSHWLCIAYAFPPINRSGTHRTLGFVKHLHRIGWDATVVTVEPEGEPLDDSLLGQIPASTNVLRTKWTDPIQRIKKLCRRHASSPKHRIAGYTAVEGRSAESPASEHSTRRWNFRDFVSRLLITPDSRVGWIRPAVSAGMKAIRRRRPNVLYSSSPYVSAHLIAMILRMRTGLPWVADFRDPWRDNPFSRLGYAALDRWDAWLEQRVMHRATQIICNTPTMRNHLCRRLPFVTGKCTTIMNGFDKERFDAIEPIRTAPADTFVLTHCGQFYGPRKPDVWLAALRLALAGRPMLAGKMKIVLVGPADYEGVSLRDLALVAGVSDHVEILDSIPHAQALSHLAGSDALILAGSSGPGADLQIPNKLFEYLAIRKPIIAALPADNPGVDILEEAGADTFICDPTDEDSIADAMIRLAQRRHGPVHAWDRVDRFDRVHRAAELAEIFDRISVQLPHPFLRPAKAASGPASIGHRSTPGFLTQ